MNPIITKEVKISADEYFKILLKKYFNSMKLWLLFPWVLIFFHFSYKENLDIADCLLALLLVSFPLYTTIYYYRFSHSKDNRIATLGRTFHFTEEELSTYMEDGSHSIIKLQNFIKIYRMKEFALFYLAKSAFIYVPRTAFAHPEDFEKVILLVEAGISKNKAQK